MLVVLGFRKVQFLEDFGLAALSLSLFICYVRIMNSFSASRTLGPKLIIILRMVCVFDKENVLEMFDQKTLHCDLK